jgi:hypothetical protein
LAHPSRPGPWLVQRGKVELFCPETDVMVSQLAAQESLPAFPRWGINIFEYDPRSSMPS